jgi:flagellar motility protein MotE (MotC chaperone)
VKTPQYSLKIEDDEERPLAALLVPDILVLLEETPEAIAAETEEMHAKDLATVAEALPREFVAPFLSALPVDRAADVLEYLDEDLRTEVLETMSVRQAAPIRSRLSKRRVPRRFSPRFRPPSAPRRRSCSPTSRSPPAD